MPTPEHLARLGHRRRREIERELATHLEDTQRELRLAGLSAPEAQRQSVERLGDMSEIIDGFARVYRTRWSTRLALALGLAGSLVVGAYSTGAFASGASAHHARTTPAGVHTTTHVLSRTPR
jgi:hypothetical protein